MKLTSDNVREYQQQIAQDIVYWGNAFEIKHPNGETERIDPTTIRATYRKPFKPSLKTRLLRPFRWLKNLIRVVFSYRIMIYRKAAPFKQSSLKIARDKQSGYLMLCDTTGNPIPGQITMKLIDNINQPPIATITAFVNTTELSDGNL